MLRLLQHPCTSIAQPDSLRDFVLTHPLYFSSLRSSAPLRPLRFILLSYRLTSARDLLEEIGDPGRVAPLVVVPGDHLDRASLASQDHRRERVEDRRVRIADDVARDDRVLAVLQDAGS